MACMVRSLDCGHMLWDSFKRVYIYIQTQVEANLLLIASGIHGSVHSILYLAFVRTNIILVSYNT